jgi:hypothetical protein
MRRASSCFRESDFPFCPTGVEKYGNGVISSSLDRRRALLLLSSFLAAGHSFGQTDAALRTALERTYVNWLQAMRGHDVAAFSAHTSRYRQMCLRNEVVSMRQAWPAAVFKSVIQAPDVSRLRLMDASAIGDTARLVYFGQVDFALESDIVTPENPLVVRFLKEDGQWKFDWIQYVNLGKDENMRRQIRGGGRTWLEGEEFQLSGVYPAVPRPCREPYQIAARHSRPRLPRHSGCEPRRPHRGREQQYRRTHHHRRPAKRGQSHHHFPRRHRPGGHRAAPGDQHPQPRRGMAPGREAVVMETCGGPCAVEAAVRVQHLHQITRGSKLNTPPAKMRGCFQWSLCG